MPGHAATRCLQLFESELDLAQQPDTSGEPPRSLTGYMDACGDLARSTSHLLEFADLLRQMMLKGVCNPEWSLSVIRCIRLSYRQTFSDPYWAVLHASFARTLYIAHEYSPAIRAELSEAKALLYNDRVLS
jgi:hypothetical protein